MTTNLNGFNTIFPMANETIAKSIEILDHLREDHAEPSMCLITLMDELKVTPREGMVLISHWQGNSKPDK